jgi:hypothetical protein
MTGQDYVSYECASGLVQFEWHYDYLPQSFPRTTTQDYAKNVQIERDFKAKSFKWLDDLENAAMAVMTAAVARGIQGKVPTKNEILYLAASMTCEQLTPQGCWPDETALVAGLCAGASVPTGVMPEVWRAFCAKIGSCGEKPLCSKQNADLVAYATAVEERRKKMLLFAGIAVAGGAAWWFLRRRR